MFDELPVNLALAVRRFQIAAGDTVDEFNIRQYGRYTGMQLEELAEKLMLLGVHSTQIAEFAKAMDTLGKEFKAGAHDTSCGRALVGDTTRNLLVDADIDNVWVSFGALNSAAVDVNASSAEVAEANLCKIAPDGLVLRDANGKICKPPGWREPDHLPHLYPVPETALAAYGDPPAPPSSGRASGFGELA